MLAGVASFDKVVTADFAILVQVEIVDSFRPGTVFFNGLADFLGGRMFDWIHADYRHRCSGTASHARHRLNSYLVTVTIFEFALQSFGVIHGTGD